jgi:hypothetical protein
MKFMIDVGCLQAMRDDKATKKMDVDCLKLYETMIVCICC